jgi:hypothetical protein
MRTVKCFRVLVGLVLLVACAFILVQQARAQITLNYANLPGTSVTFAPGGAFSFSNNASGDQFSITGVSGGVGDSVGLDGFLFPGGPFTIGAITISGPIQSAPVTGTATLNIVDGLGKDLTGTIKWDDITTIGTGGILNLFGTLNLTGITYSGSNKDLDALAATGSGADVLAFQFVPARTLTQLESTGGSTSYSGSITTVPEPGTVTLVSMGLMSFVIVLTWRRRAVCLSLG